MRLIEARMGALVVAVLLLLVAITRFMAAVGRSKLKWYMEPMVLVSSVWVIGLVIYALPIFTYREEIALSSAVYIIAAFTLFFLGTLTVDFLQTLGVSPHRLVPCTPPLKAPQQYSARLLLSLGMLGLIGLTATFVDGLLMGGLSRAGGLDADTISQARQTTMATAAAGVAAGPFQRFEQFLAATYVFIGLLTQVSCKGFMPWQRVALRLLLIVSIFLVMANQLVIRGGRMDLAILLLFIGFLAAINPKSALRNWFAPIYHRHAFLIWSAFLIVGLCIVFLLGIVFVQLRSSSSFPLLTLSVHHRMNLEPWLESIIAGSPVLETLMLTVSYLVAPFTTLSFYIDQVGTGMAGPYWGQYNFQYVSGFVMRRLGLESSWTYFWDIRAAIWAPLSNLGYGTNVWATLLRDLAIDFGWTGALACMFILGFVSKKLAYVSRTSLDPALLVAFSFVAVFLIFSFAHSMFFIQSVFPPFMYTMIVYFFVRIRSPNAASKGYKPKPAFQPAG